MKTNLRQLIHILPAAIVLLGSADVARAQTYRPFQVRQSGHIH